MSGVPDKSRQDLEWERLQRAVAERCRGPLRERLELELASDLSEMAGLLAETAEAAALLRDDEPLPLGGVREIGEHLQRLRRGGGLGGPALADLMSMLGAGRALRAFLTERAARVPHLLGACPVDRVLDGIFGSLQTALEPDGQLKDGASPRLGRLRQEVRRLRDRIVKKLEEIIHKQGSLLQDSLYTVREGRYVLPVRRDAQPRLSGIVHGASSSGATVFVEPGSVIELGNNLVLAEAELEIEQERIYGELSALAAEHCHEIDGCRAALDRADLRGAAAALGRDLGGNVPRAVEERRLRLLQVRHPLLVLAGGGAVANDLVLGSGEALVLSGPNAGGKTVALKLLGLCALMARAGLPIAADEESECGFFGNVFTDVGDEQSTAANLSTFSAHITNLTGILARADQGTLVLLDELAGGTDPQEGAALACALLAALLDRGAAVAVTTHYHPLKAMAGNDRRVRNASFSIDSRNMAPTFSLALDLPGPSSALFMAQRFGIPGAIVENASRLLPEQTRRLERLAAELGDRMETVRKQSVELEEERSRLVAARGEAERLLLEQRERDRRALSSETSRLVGEVRQAREELERVRASLKKRRLVKPEQLAAAAEQIGRAAELAAPGGELGREMRGGGEQPALEPIDEKELRPGTSVYIPYLNSEGVVMQGPRKGRVRVAVGSVKLWAETESLRRGKRSARKGRGGPSNASSAGRKGTARKPAPAAALDDLSAAGPAPADELLMRTVDNTVDVRGLRVDEALAEIERFIDRLYRQSVSVGFVVHGHGTGALREAVRAHLRGELSYVLSARAADFEQGGEAVTVFRLDT